MTQRVIVGVLIALGIEFGARYAAATTFVLADTEHLLAAADAVVLGRITSIQSVEDGQALRTNVTVAVERIVKGAYVPEITVVETGGLVADQRRWVFGTPTFFVGERVLLFVSRNSRNELHTTFLSMGKFSVVQGADGTEFAVRTLEDMAVLDPATGQMQGRPHVTVHVLRDLLRRVRRLSMGRGSGGSLRGTAIAGGSRWQSHFTFSGPPALRWFLPDEGEPVTYRIGMDGDAALGPESSVAAATAALNVWGSPACTNLRLMPGDAADNAPFRKCDRQTELVFNDPAEEIDDPVGCVGVLAIGGVCADNQNPQQFNGERFYRITEGDVMVNNGFGGCSFWNEQNLAEVLTHELGHSIGLGHASDDPSEPDPVLRDATMYYAAHFDGRGAQLMTDDQAAVCALYPSGTTGTLRLNRFAVVFGSSETPIRDRIILDGTMDLKERRFVPQVDTLILDIRGAGMSLVRLAVRPDMWRSNRTGSRYRYRGVTGTGHVTLDLAGDAPGGIRVSLRADGLDLPGIQMDNVITSIAAGGASVTEAVALRNGLSMQMYP